MLKKLTEIEISPDSPFKNDVLQRQESIGVLTNLIESTQQPFVLSVEAPWGFGKTRFIKMWQMYLESRKHICLYFNAWENDFVDDPIVAFLGEMRKFVDEKFVAIGKDDPIRTNWEEVMHKKFFRIRTRIRIKPSCAGTVFHGNERYLAGESDDSRLFKHSMLFDNPASLETGYY